MKYKVGQKFRIRTLKEAEKIYPQKEWYKPFFDCYANITFITERVDSDYNGNITLSGFVVGGCFISIRTEYNEEIILRSFGHIELDNSLFDL